MNDLFYLLKTFFIIFTFTTLSMLTSPGSILRIDAMGLLLVYGTLRFSGARYLIWLAILLGTTPLTTHSLSLTLVTFLSTLVLTLAFKKLYTHISIESYWIETTHVFFILLLSMLLQNLYWNDLLWPLIALRTLHVLCSAFVAFFAFIILDGIFRQPHSLWSHQ